MKKGEYREIRTYAYLHSSADWAVEQAEAAEDREMFPSMHALLASIFSLEAFLNHIGPKYFPETWNVKGSGLQSPTEKLGSILSRLGIEKSTLQKEYDDFALVVRVRDDLVHGRTSEVSQDKQLQMRPGSRLHSVEPEWLRVSTPKVARRVFESITRLIECIGDASGEGRLCWGKMGSGFRWIKK